MLEEESTELTARSFGVDLIPNPINYDLKNKSIPEPVPRITI